MNLPAILTACCFMGFVGGAAGQGQSNTVIDKDSNVYFIKIMPDNKIWMTGNLNIDIPGSYCYNNETQNCKEYGRLYTWSAAQEGCKLLGEGWRLPANEEWQHMAAAFGGVRDDSKDSGKAAYNALLFGGRAGFNAVYGGGRANDADSFARLEAHGFYWTASGNDANTAWFYNFGKGAEMLNRHKDGEKGRAFSVRCVKDGYDH